MDDITFWASFMANLKVAIRQASTYVMIAVGLGLQAFTANPDSKAQVVTFLGNVGMGWAAPYAGLIIIVLVSIAKAWPQVSVTKAVLENAPPAVVQAQASKNAVARSRQES